MKTKKITHNPTSVILSDSEESRTNHSSFSRKFSGFTLVELIVVITILVILGTIAFLNIGGFSGSARDARRVSDMENMEKGLNVYIAQNGTIPMPEAADKGLVTLYSGSTVIGYQGYAGNTILSAIKMSDAKDPTDNRYYTYRTSADLKKYQLLGLLEDSSTNVSFSPIMETAFAGYDVRIPFTRGYGLGVLLGSTGSYVNQPIQELVSVSGSLDVVAYTGSFAGTVIGNMKALFAKDDIITGTGTDIGAVIRGAAAPSWSVAAGGDCTTVTNTSLPDGTTSQCTDNRRFTLQPGSSLSQTYRLVMIAGKWWFNQNLAYPPATGYQGSNIWSTTDTGYYSCPGNNSATTVDCSLVSTLGYVYQWSSAMAGGLSNNNPSARTTGVCPSGWGIPTKADFTSNSNAYWPTSDFQYGGNTTGWLKSYAGYRTNDTNGTFNNRWASEYLWMSYEDGVSTSYSVWFDIGHTNTSIRTNGGKGNGYSIRCIKN